LGELAGIGMGTHLGPLPFHALCFLAFGVVFVGGRFVFVGVLVVVEGGDVALLPLPGVSG